MKITRRGVFGLGIGTAVAALVGKEAAAVEITSPDAGTISCHNYIAENFRELRDYQGVWERVTSNVDVRT
jgi:hypothetical protein